MIISVPEKFDLLFEHHDLIGLYGGRGSAKSHSIASSLILCAGPHSELIPSSSRYLSARAGHDPAPEVIGCFRETQKSLRNSSKRLLEMKIRELGYEDYFKSTDSEIRGKRGELFFFSGLRDPDTARSTEGMTKFWVEEASEVSQQSMEVLLPTLRTPWASGIFSWNPDSEKDPVDKYFRAVKDGAIEGLRLDIVAREINYYDNKFFPDFLRKQMEYDRARDIDLYNHVWLGKYRKNTEACVFRNWRVEMHEAPEDTIFYYGGDWGFSNDPSVLVRCYIDEEKRTIYVDYEAYAIGCEINDTPLLFAEVPDSGRNVIRADSARPETISYMQKHGYPLMTPAAKGPNSVMEGVQFLRSYDIVVHPRCKHTIDELSYYSWKVHPKTLEITNILEDKKNHVIDSLRYALEDFRTSTSSEWAKLAKS